MINMSFGQEDRYKNILYLGQGSFGKVYQCYDNVNKENIVCKWIEKDNPAPIFIIEQEIRNLKHMKGSHYCIEMLDHFEHDKYTCILFPPMYSSLYSSWTYPWKMTKNYSWLKSFVYQLISGVAEIHSRNMIHTDLKPANILFTDSSEKNIVIIDFGSAVLPDDYHYCNITTTYYRAPEVVLNQEWNYKVDIWSLGCILFEVYTGHILFRNEEEDDFVKHLLMFENLLEPVPSIMQNDIYSSYLKRKNKFTIRCKINLKEYFKDEHQMYYDIMMKMLTIDPQKRPSAEQLLKDPIFVNLGSLTKDDFINKKYEYTCE